MSIRNTGNVFRALLAALIAVQRHNTTASHPITTLACPGLGTATGQMLYAEAARQMALADHYFLAPPERIDWKYAVDRHKAIQG